MPGLVTLNPTTGAVDPFMNIQLSGHHSTGTVTPGWVGPWDIAANAAGTELVVIGEFITAQIPGGPALSRQQILMVGIGPAAGSSATIEAWNTQAYVPQCFNWAFDAYVRGVTFSPDGSYFIVDATGGGNAGTACDATSRFETDPTNANANPTWIDQTGGDTVWATTVTNSAVYIGGHNRWNNNPLGVDHAQPGAVPRPGLAALDPVSGRPFTWNPGRNPLGAAVFAEYATPTGLWIGSDTIWIGNYKYQRPRLAFFPYAGGYSPTSTATNALPGTVYVAGSKVAANSNVLYRVHTGGEPSRPSTTVRTGPVTPAAARARTTSARRATTTPQATRRRGDAEQQRADLYAHLALRHRAVVEHRQSGDDLLVPGHAG